MRAQAETAPQPSSGKSSGGSGGGGGGDGGGGGGGCCGWASSGGAVRAKEASLVELGAVGGARGNSDLHGATPAGSLPYASLGNQKGPSGGLDESDEEDLRAGMDEDGEDDEDEDGGEEMKDGRGHGSGGHGKSHGSSGHGSGGRSGHVHATSDPTALVLAKDETRPLGATVEVVSFGAGLRGGNGELVGASLQFVVEHDGHHDSALYGSSALGSGLGGGGGLGGS